MTGPSWYSQPFPGEGGSLAEGIRKQLGSPRLDLLTILVRESAQNSWDARLRDLKTPVDYRIDLSTVAPVHAVAWQELLSTGAPVSEEQLPLRHTLRSARIQLLVVSDRGTTGLGGPTRADEVADEEHDFVSFVRNIGEPRDTELGGGTYGFGKGVFYLLSRPGTILLYTRCRTDMGFESRLIGCALWSSYVADGRRYTGRHWWGTLTNGVVEPLVGSEADQAARRLGLPSFDPDETGTTIVVVDPDLDGLEQRRAADYLAETIGWNLWPKMLAAPDGIPPMRFAVTCDGLNHSVPDPRRTRPLDLFVAAYENMKSSDGSTLACRRPRQDLGRFGFSKRIMPPLEPTDASQMMRIERSVHHVCLMRPAELVVTYLEGQKPFSENLHYAAVFRADSALDQVYADAEPPTHDAWNAESLRYPGRTYVNTTFARIKEALNSFDLQGTGLAGGSAKVALGAASAQFGALIAGGWGLGGATDYRAPGDIKPLVEEPTPAPSFEEVIEDWGGSGGRTESDFSTTESRPPLHDNGLEEAHGTPPSDPLTISETVADVVPPSPPSHDRQSAIVRPAPRPTIEYIGEPYFAERSGLSVLIQEVRVPVPVPQRLRAELDVALAGAAREIDPPMGAEMPVLIGWEQDSSEMDSEPAPVVEGGDGQVFRAVVRPAPDTVTLIRITSEVVQAQ